MKDKLCVTDRRLKIIDLLIANGQMTRSELAQEFNVTMDTISNDILFLSSHIPLYTKAGVGGGIFILNGYKGYSYYFDRRETEVMLSLLEHVPKKDRKVLLGIIAIMSKGHFTSNSHFIALCGITTDGKVLVANSASYRRSE